MAKIGNRQVRDVAKVRHDKLVGKSESAKAIEERQRQEKGAQLYRGSARKGK